MYVCRFIFFTRLCYDRIDLCMYVCMYVRVCMCVCVCMFVPGLCEIDALILYIHT